MNDAVDQAGGLVLAVCMTCCILGDQLPGEFMVLMLVMGLGLGAFAIQAGR